MTKGINGKLKTVSEVADFSGVAVKSLYEWLHISKTKGIEGFNSKPRKVANSKSKDENFRKEVFELAIAFPDLSAAKLIEKLSKKYQRISDTCVQDMLRDNNLHIRSKRFAAAERVYVNGPVEEEVFICRETVNKLIENNPYLDLFSINSRVEGTIFFLNAISLVPYFGKNTGYILLGIDTKSLIVYSLVWDGTNEDELKEFVRNLKSLFGGKNKNDVYFECDNKWPFNELKSEKSIPEIRWLNSAKFHYSVNRYSIAFKVTINDIRKRFLRLYKFSNLEKLRIDLDNFFMEQTISTGPLGYPTFGKNRYHVHKSYIDNIAYQPQSSHTKFRTPSTHNSSDY
jgi:hypothetical protein